jgi:hypothetical protein
MPVLTSNISHYNSQIPNDINEVGQQPQVSFEFTGYCLYDPVYCLWYIVLFLKIPSNIFFR